MSINQYQIRRFFSDTASVLNKIWSLWEDFLFFCWNERQLNNESRRALLCKLHFRHIWKFMSVLIMMKYWNYYIPAYTAAHLSLVIFRN
jgi:hypothetical protein